MNKAHISIVTDSTADLPAALLDRYHIHVVPAILVIDGHSLEDGRGITRQEFYERMPKMKKAPTTSAPSSGAFAWLYQELLQGGASQVVSIHVDSHLSGIYNVARVAAHEFGERVQVIDSGQLSLGLGFQVVAAAQACLAGETLPGIQARLAALRPRLRAMAMLDTLEYVRRSGRVSWLSASMGSLLQIKPFLSIAEGHVSRLGEARTRRKGIQRLYQILRSYGPLESLAVLHTNAEADALEMQQAFASEVPEPPLVVNVTTTIGTHIGPNALGFAAVLRNS